MSDDDELTFADFPAAGSEVESLLGALDRIRRTFAWKCGGLDAAGLRTTLGPSTVTLGGLLKHMALVEEDSFHRRLLGRDYSAPWDSVDFDATPDWEWTSAADDSPEQLQQLWRAAVIRSKAAVEEALTDGGIDRLVAQTPWTEKPSLRRVLIDMNEEYARHTGHADLIRESIDGLVGEDPRE